MIVRCFDVLALITSEVEIFFVYLRVQEHVNHPPTQKNIVTINSTIIDLIGSLIV